HYITMEYVPGEDLKSFIRRIGQLPGGKSISIAKQVCDGLAEAHRLGVIHRDLKPQNIMIDKEGNARIMDFGIARSLKAKGITGAGVMIGTPEYMSPEQVEGKEVDQRSDIYSLGVILYEMVTGRVPFEGDTPFTIGVKHKSEHPKNPRELNTQIPEDLSKVILRCLEKDKENRFQSAGELRSELTRIEQGIPTTEREIPKRKPITSKEITVTFNVKRVIVPALLVLALVLTVFIVWRVFLRKETPSPTQQKQGIAVISFENQTGDTQFDHLSKIIPNLLITSLEQSGYFDVMSWERMRDLIEQLDKEDVEFIDRDLGFELCRKEGINTIVLGSYGKAGDMFATDVKILDVETKELLKSASASGEGEGSIIRTQIDELSREILQGTGISERRLETGTLKIANFTTGSIEAYDYFLKGRRADEKFDNVEALEFFKKAVEIDPNFAAAYLWLCFQHRSLGNTESADEALERALVLSENATKKARLFIEIAYALWIEGDLNKGVGLLEKMTEEFPKEKSPHYWLAINLDYRNQFEQAIEEYNKALTLDPNFSNALNMIAYTYLNMDKYDKALEYFERYEAQLPGDPNPIDSTAELYLHMGRLDEALSKYKDVLKIKPDFGSRLQIAYIYALKESFSEAAECVEQHITTAPSPGIKAAGFLWRGFYRYWLGIRDRFISDMNQAKMLADSVGNERLKARVDWLIGWIYYDRGELILSRKHMKNWFEIYVDIRPLYKADYSVEYNFLLGLIDLKEGLVDEAKSRLSEIKTFLPQSMYTEESGDFLIYFLTAEVLLAESSFDAAVSAYKKLKIPKLLSWSNDLDPMYYNFPSMRDTLPRIYVQMGELDKAIDGYEKLVTFNPEKRERRFIHPKFHYRLANLYEQKNWKGKAIEHYEKFLDLWKDADPGLPEVEDAGKRLKALHSK
ncbi:MAG: tetratricopeptide repeat protein, partial [Candidatus Aminicenantes bacterium]|nr:tetratricopeptide repeat protein [Candidatus Aminicenantes bacterium]